MSRNEARNTWKKSVKFVINKSYVGDVDIVGVDDSRASVEQSEIFAEKRLSVFNKRVVEKSPVEIKKGPGGRGT